MGGTDGGPGTGNYWWWALGALSGGAGSIDGMIEGAVFLNSVDWAGIPRPSRSTLLRVAATLACWMSPGAFG
jgi:hypothetical protein